jgi:glutamine synthetase
LFGGRTPWENCPRSILKSVLARAEALGYRFNLGVETEFYVYRRDALPELVPLAAVSRLHPTPCYDVETALDSLDFLGRVSGYMSKCGFSLFPLDQEGGDGQYELDFSHDECLAACDRLTLLRLMLRQVAKELDAVVTFMPKPARGVWGSGAHMNMSLESLDTGENLFRSPSGGWTKLAMSFVDIPATAYWRRPSPWPRASRASSLRLTPARPPPRPCTPGTPPPFGQRRTRLPPPG